MSRAEPLECRSILVERGAGKAILEMKYQLGVFETAPRQCKLAKLQTVLPKSLQALIK